MKEIKLNKLNEVIYYDVCDNGLEIYMWTNDKVNNYYATLNVKYGSCDTKFKIKDKEYKVPNGIAHFLEHINFHESDGTTADMYFNKSGSGTNAFTTFEYTAYEIFGSNDIIKNVGHLLDFVQDKALSDDIIDNERNIIIEEAKMGKNNPGQRLFYESNKALYNVNNKRNEIVGSVKDINSITKQDLNLVYDTFYRPDNMFIVITGNFNPYEIATMIKENQSKKKYKELNVKKIYDKEDVNVNKDYIEIKDNIEIPKLSISYKMNRKRFKDYNDAILRIYLNLIMNANFGPTSDFKEDLMEKELIYSMSSGISVEKDVVILDVIAESKYPNELIEVIKNNFDKLSITEDRLERRKKCNIASLISGLDSIEYVNSHIEDDIIYNNKLINNIYDVIKKINIDDANKILKHLDISNSSIVVMLPEK